MVCRADSHPLLYLGGKWKPTAIGAYPTPRRHTIVEPYAGFAGYSLWWAVHPQSTVKRILLGGWA